MGPPLLLLLSVNINVISRSFIREFYLSCSFIYSELLYYLEYTRNVNFYQIFKKHMLIIYNKMSDPSEL